MATEWMNIITSQGTMQRWYREKAIQKISTSQGAVWRARGWIRGRKEGKGLWSKRDGSRGRLRDLKRNKGKIIATILYFIAIHSSQSTLNMYRVLHLKFAEGLLRDQRADETATHRDLCHLLMTMQPPGGRAGARDQEEQQGRQDRGLSSQVRGASLQFSVSHSLPALKRLPSSIVPPNSQLHFTLPKMDSFLLATSYSTFGKSNFLSIFRNLPMCICYTFSGDKNKVLKNLIYFH